MKILSPPRFPSAPSHWMMFRRTGALLLLGYCLCLGSCVAVKQRKMWRYRQYIVKTEPNKPFIEVILQRPGFWLPLPVLAWEINTDKRYLLELDFHTKMSEYAQLDSIRYEIYTTDKRVLAAGVLPIYNGKLSVRAYSPDVYRAQCSTPPRIVLGNPRQELTGTFILYATDISAKKTSLSFQEVTLHYFSPRIAPFL